MKRLNEKDRLRRDLYDAIMKYDEYLSFIDFADKNNFTNIDYIDLIRHKVNTLEELLNDYYEISSFKTHEKIILDLKLWCESDDYILEEFKGRTDVEISHIEMKLIIQDIADTLVEFAGYSVTA